MNHTKISKILTVLFAVVLCFGPVGLADPLGTAFTYQGRLIDANQAADGWYDFQFKLYDANTAGNKVASDVNISNTDVVDGYFTVLLDFGSVFDGNNRWLEIGVRPGTQNDPNIYTALSPRQKVTPAPYAIYSLNGGGGGSLWQVNGTSIYYNNGNVGVGTISPATKLHVAGVITDASGNSNNWNTAYGWGNHALAGYLKLDGSGYVNATSGYKISGNTILSVPGLNMFSGVLAGQNNTTGYNNTFSGTYAGRCNTEGYDNTFTGYQAGQYNTTGNDNTFSGYQAGVSNTTGMFNTFTGAVAGLNNNTGYNNTFSGTYAGRCNTEGYDNTFTGYVAGQNNTTGSYNMFTGSFAGYSNTTGYDNTFSGFQAGQNNTTGYQNTFSGYQAGLANTTGTYNTFSGYQAGNSNTIGSDNTFSGCQAGYSNTTSYYNTFSGCQAGLNNTEGGSNTFSGHQAGFSNTTGFGNTFSGYRAGCSNITGYLNVFIGYAAGYSETGSNKLYIANNFPGALIYGDFSANTLGFGTTSIPAGYAINTATGAYLTTGGVWTNNSSRDLKENITPVDAREVLEKLVSVPVSTWNYKVEDQCSRHVGPMAQDFYAAFGLNDSDTSIATIDADGISLAAIQGLYQIVKEKDSDIAALKKENEEIKARLATMESLVSKLSQQEGGIK